MRKQRILLVSTLTELLVIVVLGFAFWSTNHQVNTLQEKLNQDERLYPDLVQMHRGVPLDVQNSPASLMPLYIKEVCGNGYIESREECDDGNQINGDGCNRRCAIEPTSTIQNIDSPAMDKL